MSLTSGGYLTGYLTLCTRSHTLCAALGLPLTLENHSLYTKNIEDNHQEHHQISLLKLLGS